MNFFKTMLASALGTLVAFVAAFLLFIILIVALVVGGEKETLPETGVLHLHLNQPILERGNDQDLLPFDLNTFQKKEAYYLDFLKRDLERAKTDSHVAGIYLELDGISGSPSTLKDVRTLLQDFKSSGKWIIAYGENYTQADYYVASSADEVYIYPTGMLDWRGLNGEVMFFKKLLDELEIEAQVIRGRDNKYKSAVEPFLYDHMSAPNKEQMKALLDGIWNTMLTDIATHRPSVSVETLNQAAADLKYVQINQAIEDHVVDGLLHYDEVLSRMNTRMSKEANEKVEMIDYSEYHDQNMSLENEMDLSSSPEVAVVYAVGQIEEGKGSDEVIGSDRIAAALRKARTDEDVKAVVLRVNSPGGSALASDVIWRETQLIKQAGKPLVVSMGDLAASGGYYISCAADRIFANPNTITGSIGVFGVIPNIGNMLDHKLGITFDRYETHEHADFLSINKSFDAVEMQKMNDMIIGIYDDFLNRVADGRKLSVSQVDSMARGRVWTGEDALKMGLVDELGDLQKAIEHAANLASLGSDYHLKTLPKMESPFELMLSDAAEARQDLLLKEISGDRYAQLVHFKQMLERPSIQMRMPFDIVLR
jgi:protease-4